MDFLRYQRPVPSMNPDGPSYENPNQFGDFGGEGGGLRGLGFLHYLQGQGYDGQRGAGMFQFAQQLRQQGQHPWMDYMHNEPPHNGGIVPPGFQPMPQWGAPIKGNLGANGFPSGGLMSLARKRPPFIQQ